jgi:hypothetical protein
MSKSLDKAQGNESTSGNMTMSCCSDKKNPETKSKETLK